jgi:ABC-type branched-subunit amino acid transport system substrate-binding protein
VGVSVQTTPVAHAASANSSDTTKAIQEALKKFDSARDLAISERAALVAKLEAAKTDAEKAAVVAQLNRDQDQREDEMRAVARQIRDETKQVRYRTRN